MRLTSANLVPPVINTVDALKLLPTSALKLKLNCTCPPGTTAEVMLTEGPLPEPLPVPEPATLANEELPPPPQAISGRHKSNNRSMQEPWCNVDCQLKGIAISMASASHASRCDGQGGAIAKVHLQCLLAGIECQIGFAAVFPLEYAVERGVGGHGQIHGAHFLQAQEPVQGVAAGVTQFKRTPAIPGGQPCGWVNQAQILGKYVLPDVGRIDLLAARFPERNFWFEAGHIAFHKARVRSKIGRSCGQGQDVDTLDLARRCKKVIAVDNSGKIVAFGAAKAKKNGLKNLEFRLGDLQNPPIEPNSVDLVILSQALHHAEDPAKAICSAHKILKRGGQIMVLDLLRHNFEKARELYGDRWLGFAESDLHRWLESARFKRIEISVVAREESPPHFQTILASGEKR